MEGKLVNRLNILLLAYSCRPNVGSEPGVGWNTALESSKLHNVYVFTHISNKKFIDEELLKIKNPNLNFLYLNFHNFFLDLNKRYGTRVDYFFWNLFSFKFLSRLDQEINFDIVHHVTFNQYRSINFGFFTKKPFVFGPIGGAENIKFYFLKDLSFTTFIKEIFRIFKIDIWLFSFLLKINSNNKFILYSSFENQKNLNFKSNYILDSEVYPAIGFSNTDFPSLNSRILNGDFSMIYAGRAEDWKGLEFLFRVLNKIQIKKISLKLIGIRSLEERFKIENWIKKYKINCEIIIVDSIPRNELLNLLGNSNLFVYPAFRDSGSMAILEASVVGCPTLCLKVGGQDLLPEDSFLLVDLFESYEITLVKFSEKLMWSYENRDKLHEIGIKAQAFASKNYQWSDKILFYNEIYKSLIK